jgi:hypothetical protein
VVPAPLGGRVHGRDRLGRTLDGGDGRVHDIERGGEYRRVDTITLGHSRSRRIGDGAAVDDGHRRTGTPLDRRISPG